MDYSERYKKTVDFFESHLREYFGVGGFSTLEKGMEYSLFSGGKRIRPCIMLECGKMFGALESDVLPFATAVEMIHTYSLIHDDLPCMDNDDLRRGMPTNHKVFGEGNAVLNGDTLLNLAFETMLNAIDNKKKLTLARIIAKASGREGMCSGQSADLYFEKKQSTLKDVEYINDNKTGTLLKVCFVGGGILGNANEEELSKMEILGKKYGEMFQLTDDLLDVKGDVKLVGKTLGKDKAVKKSSYVNVFGVEKAEERVSILYGEFIGILNSLDVDKSFLTSLASETAKRNF